MSSGNKSKGKRRTFKTHTGDALDLELKRRGERRKRGHRFVNTWRRRVERAWGPEGDGRRDRASRRVSSGDLGDAERWKSLRTDYRLKSSAAFNQV